MFLLSHLWARVLFDFGASHSFIAASCVRELGLEVETLEKPLYVSSLLWTRERGSYLSRLRVRDLWDFTHSGPEGHGHVRVRRHP